MILGMDHIAIFGSSEESVRFYEKLGFRTVSRREREHDTVLFLSGYGITLELFLDPSRPPRPNAPEALGLRHLALHVDDVQRTLDELGLEAEPIRELNGSRLTFLHDPDGLPVELTEGIL